MQSFNRYQPLRPARPVKKRRLRSRLAVLALVVLLIMAGLHLFGDNKLSGLTSDSEKVSASSITPLVLTAAQKTQMSSQINSVIQAHPDMDIGVAIQDLNDRQVYNYGLSQPFIAASVGKLITASLFLHEVEQGKQSLNQQLSYGSASYELQQMIEQSDNTAWNDLNTLLTHATLQSYATQIGLSNYDPDQNTLTANDIAVLLGKLYKGELLNADDTSLLMSYMHDANYDSYIPASIPAGVKVYHKAGWLSDRVHDSAIIDNGKHPYVLVIFTKEDDGSDYNATEGHQIFAAITTATVQAFIQN